MGYDDGLGRLQSIKVACPCMYLGLRCVVVARGRAAVKNESSQHSLGPTKDPETEEIWEHSLDESQ